MGMLGKVPLIRRETEQTVIDTPKVPETQDLSHLVIKGENADFLHDVLEVVGPEGMQDLVLETLSYTGESQDPEKDSVLLERMITEKAALMGIKPEQFGEALSNAYDAYYDKAVQYLEGKGIGNGRKALEWAEKNLPEASLRQAAFRFFMGRVDGLDAIGREFMHTT
jgi:hypothetical protein